MIDQTSHPVSINRLAVISAIAGVLCIASFCTALAPIPLTDWLCYPATGGLALLALGTGVASLVQIRVRGDRGLPCALVGAGVGAVTLVAALCAASLSILIVLKLVGWLHQQLGLPGPEVRL